MSSPNAFSRWSSVLPPRLAQEARREGFGIGEQSRGFAFNADLRSLVQFLDIGTPHGRPAMNPPDLLPLPGDTTVASTLIAESPTDIRLLWSPKEGNTEAQYEDASSIYMDGDTVTIAVADGASAAIYAREWAELLAKWFAKHPPTDYQTAADAISELARLWQTNAESGNADGKLPWYALEKLPQGSSATLLVVRIEKRNRKLWAWAIGDACLFIVQNDELAHSFPCSRSDQFDDRPSLIATHLPLPAWSVFETDVQPGDTLLLMTDAIAAWFLTEHEAKRKPWSTLPAHQADLTAWLKTKRDNGAMKNDDVTLLRIAID